MMIETDLAKEVYTLYGVDSISIPKEIPSTGEIIGYDYHYPEWTELKCYRMNKFLLDLGFCVDQIKFDTNEYEIEVKNKDIFTIGESKSLEDCMLEALLKLYDKLPEHYQLAIRNELMKEYD